MNEQDTRVDRSPKNVKQSKCKVGVVGRGGELYIIKTEVTAEWEGTIA